MLFFNVLFNSVVQVCKLNLKGFVLCVVKKYFCLFFILFYFIQLKENCWFDKYLLSRLRYSFSWFPLVWTVHFFLIFSCQKFFQLSFNWMPVWMIFVQIFWSINSWCYIVIFLGILFYWVQVSIFSKNLRMLNASLTFKLRHTANNDIHVIIFNYLFIILLV